MADRLSSFLARPSRALSVIARNRSGLTSRTMRSWILCSSVMRAYMSRNSFSNWFEGKTVAHDVEHLVGAQFAADFLQPFEQLLQDAALAGVLGHEVEDQAVVLLAVTVDAADALFQADGVPGDVEVDHQPAELQVDAFAGGLGGNQHLGRFLELALGVDARARRVAVADLHAAVDLRERQAPLAELAQRALVAAVAGQVVEGVLVLGEDQQPHLRDRRRCPLRSAPSAAC